MIFFFYKEEKYNAGSTRFSQVQQGSKRFNVRAGSNRTDGPSRTPRKGSPPRKGSVQVQVFWIRWSAMAMGNQNTMHMCLCFFSRSCFRTCCDAWEHGQQFSCEPHHNISKAVKVRHARIRAVISIDLRKKHTVHRSTFDRSTIEGLLPIC